MESKNYIEKILDEVRENPELLLKLGIINTEDCPNDANNELKDNWGDCSMGQHDWECDECWAKALRNCGEN